MHNKRPRPPRVDRTGAAARGGRRRGYLGAVQVKQGHLDEACSTWNQALDAMSGIHSGRARDVIVRMQSDLSPVRKRGGRHVAELDRRAREILRTIG